MKLYVINPHNERPHNICHIANVADYDDAARVVQSLKTIEHPIIDTDHAQTMMMFMSDHPHDMCTYVASDLPPEILAQSFDCANDEF